MQKSCDCLKYLILTISLIYVTLSSYFPYCCFRFVQTMIFIFQVNPAEEEKEAQEDLEAIKEVKVKELNQPIRSGLVLSAPQRRPLVIPVK